MNPYFGEPWDSTFAANSEQVPTPVGETCLECREVIVDGDQGVIVPCVLFPLDGSGRSTTSAPAHRECLLLSVIGHVAGTCFCHEGLGTHRERGRATVAWQTRRRAARYN